MLSLVQPPILAPVTLAEAKANSRVTQSAEDALITAMIDAATQACETVMRRAIMPQQWRLTLEEFGPVLPDAAFVYLSPTQWRLPTNQSSGIIYLKRPIVSAVNSVKYVDTSGVQQTLVVNTDYQVDTTSSDLYGRIAPAYGKGWPATRAQMGAVEVLFTCGWPDAASVPANIKRWILAQTAALYEHREAWTLGKKIEANPNLDRLIARWIVPAV